MMKCSTLLKNKSPAKRGCNTLFFFFLLAAAVHLFFIMGNIIAFGVLLFIAAAVYIVFVLRTGLMAALRALGVPLIAACVSFHNEWF